MTSPQAPQPVELREAIATLPVDPRGVKTVQLQQVIEPETLDAIMQLIEQYGREQREDELRHLTASEEYDFGATEWLKRKVTDRITELRTAAARLGQEGSNER